MAAYLPMKLKRKGLDAVNDDFSLSSPARKIRRLDADLPPIVEEEAEMPFQSEQRPGFPVIEELPPAAENEERAIVLFKPMNTPLLYSPSKFVVDSNLISSIRDQALWGTYSNPSRPREDEEEKMDDSLSMIPWVPHQNFLHSSPAEASEKETSDPMEAEETGPSFGSAVCTGVQPANDFIDRGRSVESMQQQWQQQHCVIPQPSGNTTPLVWYRHISAENLKPRRKSEIFTVQINKTIIQEETSEEAHR